MKNINEKEKLNQKFCSALSIEDKVLYLRNYLKKIELSKEKRLPLMGETSLRSVPEAIKKEYVNCVSMLNEFKEKKTQDIQRKLSETKVGKEIGKKCTISNLKICAASFFLATSILAGNGSDTINQSQITLQRLETYIVQKYLPMIMDTETVEVHCEPITSTLNNNYEVHQIIRDEFLDYPRLNCISENVYYHTGKNYECSEQEIMALAKLVDCEAGGLNEEEKYIDCMGVMSIILNRIEDVNFSNYGQTPLEQIQKPGQFIAYEKSLEMSDSDVSPIAVQAVRDCLSGVRNNDFVSFRAKENYKEGRVQLVEDGNYYFEVMESTLESYNVQILK